MRSTTRLVLQAKGLNQPDDMPAVVYKTKKGKVIYLTGNKIAKLLQRAVKEVRPDTTSDKLKRYSTHSLRVWACVLLNEAGKLPDYIMKRFQWLGDSFRMYLRDTANIGGHGPNLCIANGRYCPVYYDGGNGRSRHAQMRRRNGLRDI